MHRVPGLNQYATLCCLSQLTIESKPTSPASGLLTGQSLESLRAGTRAGQACAETLPVLWVVSNLRHMIKEEYPRE